MTDGTAAGTSIIVDTSPGAELPPEMLGFGRRLFFNSYDRDHGPCMANDYNLTRRVCGELWSSDGTAAGTRLFKDLNPGVWPSGPYDFFANSGRTRFYFRALAPGSRDPATLCLVWVSDGTPEGTRPLASHTSFSCSQIDELFQEVHGRVYFQAGFGEVYRAGATPEETVSLWQLLGW